jgi:hypothetical protein
VTFNGLRFLINQFLFNSPPLQHLTQLISNVQQDLSVQGAQPSSLVALLSAHPAYVLPIGSLVQPIAESLPQRSLLFRIEALALSVPTKFPILPNLLVNCSPRIVLSSSLGLANPSRSSVIPTVAVAYAPKTLP